MTRRPGIGSWYFPYPITAAASAAWYAKKGVVAGEDGPPDEDSRCDRCEMPVEAFDLQVIHNDEAVCDTCARALLHVEGDAA